jgi:hypothetical protein
MNLHHLVLHLGPNYPLTDSALRSLVLLYIGPDQMLPLTSALGAAVGVLLIVWNRLVSLLRKGWQWVQVRRGNG